MAYFGGLSVSNTSVAGSLYKQQGVDCRLMFFKQILISALVMSAPMGLQKRQVDGLGIAEQVLSRVIDGLNAGGVTAGAKGVEIARGVIRQVRKGTGAGGAAPIPPAPKTASAPPAEAPAPPPPVGAAEVEAPSETGVGQIPSQADPPAPIPAPAGQGEATTSQGNSAIGAAKGGVGIAQGVLDRVQQGLGNAGVEAGAQGVEIAKQILAQVANGL
jgi:hypothetical protein